MSVKSLGSNQTEVSTSTLRILVSYSTPVAYQHLPSGACFQTATHYSPTTCRHITRWLEGRKAEKVPQASIDALI